MEQKFLKIEPMHDKKAFLRKAWVELANEDVPLDVFKSDFSDVKIEEYHILKTSATFSANWQGDIGNCYSEPYEDFETYYEEVPYLGLEEKYDYTIGYYNVQAEKTRREERQRKVIRYREKTEWHFSNGRYSGEVGSFECVDPKGTFSTERYEKDVDSKYYICFTDEELSKATDMTITDTMMKRVDELHKVDGERKMCASLPGDEYQNITYRFECIPICATLMRFPEYCANIIYNGNAYERRAFAFGKMTLVGGKVNNPLDTKAVIKKKKEDADIYIKSKKAATEKAIKEKEAETNKVIKAKESETDKAIKEKESATDKAIKEKEYAINEIILKRTLAIDTKVWNKTKVALLSSVALLLISTIISAVLRFLAPVIIFFVCALAGLVVSKIFYKKIRDEIEKDAENKNSADRLELKEYADYLTSECKQYINGLTSECKQYIDGLNAECKKCIAALDKQCAAECKAYMDNLTLECENYEKSRRSDILAALNAKLASLGMSPASVDEYSV